MDHLMLLSLGQKKAWRKAACSSTVFTVWLRKEIVAEKQWCSLTRFTMKPLNLLLSKSESMKFNTAIAQLMVFVNAATKEAQTLCNHAKGFIQLIAPFAPHLAEELWQNSYSKQWWIHLLRGLANLGRVNWLKTKSKSSSKSKEKSVPNLWSC